MKTEEKKFTTKFFAALMVFLLTAGGAFAQEAGDFGNADDDGNISYITVGKTMPFFVAPDSYYHPGWSAISNDITPGFTWNWAPADGQTWGWGTELTQGNQNLNYVEVTAIQTGDFVLNVKEQAPEEFGGCEDLAGTDITVRVVEAPEIHSFPSFLDDLGIEGGQTHEQCGNVAGFDASVELSGFPNLQVRWSLERQEIDLDGDPVGDPVSVDGGETIVGGGGSFTRQENQTFVFDTNRNLEVFDNKRTMYTYTITGITDLVSRRSDYLEAETTWYDADPVTFVVIVNPAPETGPIYHIPAGFGEL